MREYSIFFVPLSLRADALFFKLGETQTSAINLQHSYGIVGENLVVVKSCATTAI